MRFYSCVPDFKRLTIWYGGSSSLYSAFSVNLETNACLTGTFG
jgi:hypothetical protein